MRLPSRTYLDRQLASDASSILDAHELDLRRYYPDDSGVTYMHRGRAYYRGLTARKLKRIAEIRQDLGL